MRGRLLRFCALFTAFLLLCGCAPQAEVPLSRTEFLLNTVVTISLYDSEDEAALSAAFDEVRRLEALLSDTIAGSDISRINTAGGAWVQVAPETMALLEQSIAYAQLSNGLFDPTAGGLTSLWDFSAEQPALPDEKLLSEAAAQVDYRALELDASAGRARLQNPQAQLDLGGIAKGYIADQVAKQLAQSGVRSALLDLGGNIYALGSKAGEDWAIGVRLPTGEQDELIAAVYGQQLSVVTAGSYERGFTIEGTRYHHILDLESGYPVESDLLGVTILSDESVQGDALSTICFLLGLEEGLALLEGIDGVEGLFITQDGSLHATSGAVYEAA